MAQGFFRRAQVPPDAEAQIAAQRNALAAARAAFEKALAIRKATGSPRLASTQAALDDLKAL